VECSSQVEVEVEVTGHTSEWGKWFMTVQRNDVRAIYRYRA